MSHWLQLLAELKRRNPTDYLTSTQREVHDRLCERLQFPQWINMFGAVGTGKTFVAWSIARATGAYHVPLPSLLEKLSSIFEILLLDNAPFREADIRRLLASCDLLGAKSVVIISRQPVAMSMQKIELSAPSGEDIAAVLRSLGRLGYYQHRDLPLSPNLWDVLQVCI